MSVSVQYASLCMQNVEARIMRMLALEEDRRADGRRCNEVRPISSRAGLLPCTHGSALFTRGETQTIAVTTLGVCAAREAESSHNIIGCLPCRTRSGCIELLSTTGCKLVCFGIALRCTSDCLRFQRLTPCVLQYCAIHCLSLTVYVTFGFSPQFLYMQQSG